MEKQPLKVLPGFVYLGLRDDGAYKLGRSELPSERIYALRCQGHKVTLIWTLRCADMVTTERALQQRWARYYSGEGEWFLLPEDIVAWVCQQTEASACEGYDPSTYCRPDSRRYRGI